MANTSFASLLAAAEEAGVGFYTPPNGNFDLVVKRANMSATKNGDPKIGLQLAIQGGPEDGKSFWTNFNFIPTNQTGLAISFRQMNDLGFTKDNFLALPEDKEQASDAVASALTGTTFNADVEVKQSGEYTNINLKRIKRAGAGTVPAPAGEAPAPAAPIPGAPTF